MNKFRFMTATKAAIEKNAFGWTQEVRFDRDIRIFMIELYLKLHAFSPIVG